MLSCHNTARQQKHLGRSPILRIPCYFEIHKPDREIGLFLFAISKYFYYSQNDRHLWMPEDLGISSYMKSPVNGRYIF